MNNSQLITINDVNVAPRKNGISPLLLPLRQNHRPQTSLRQVRETVVAPDTYVDFIIIVFGSIFMARWWE